MKQLSRWLYYFINEDLTKDEILPETLSYLESLYATYNNNLFNMLKEKGYNNMPFWLCNGETHSRHQKLVSDSISVISK